MDAVYVLYDFNLEAAYNIESMSDRLAVEENTFMAERGESVRWIPTADFMNIRKQYIIATVAKEGEWYSSKLTFRSLEHAEEVARKLGGEVRVVSVF